jgi:putative flippase GtrA
MDWNRSNFGLLFLQVCRFGLVGLLATFVQTGLFTLFVAMGVASPLKATVLAFFPAFMVSFFGHLYWTFQAHSGKFDWNTFWRMGKFLFVALLGLGMNSFWVYLITDVFFLKYYIATLFFLFVTPGFLFILNKYIVFA